MFGTVTLRNNFAIRALCHAPDPNHSESHHDSLKSFTTAISIHQQYNIVNEPRLPQQGMNANRTFAQRHDKRTLSYCHFREPNCSYE